MSVFNVSPLSGIEQEVFNLYDFSRRQQASVSKRNPQKLVFTSGYCSQVECVVASTTRLKIAIDIGVECMEIDLLPPTTLSCCTKVSLHSWNEAAFDPAGLLPHQVDHLNDGVDSQKKVMHNHQPCPGHGGVHSVQRKIQRHELLEAYARSRGAGQMKGQKCCSQIAHSILGQK